MTFTKAWLAEAKRILKPTGSMWIFGTYHNIGVINVICQMLNKISMKLYGTKEMLSPNLAGED